MPSIPRGTKGRPNAWRALLIVLFALILLTHTEVRAQTSRKTARRGESLLREGKYEKAVESFRKALSEDRRDLRARLGMCLALMKLGRYDLAYEEAGQAVSLEPLNARAHAMLGTALLRSGNFGASIEEFRTALNKNPREPFAIAGMSEVDFYENRAQDAFNKIKIASFLEPMEPEFYLQMARSASRLEMYTATAEAYEQFLRVAPFTETDQRDRIKGLIQFFRYLGNIRLHRLKGAEVAAVPFTLYKNRPYIEATINDKGPFRFVVDSGAGISVLSYEAAKRLGLSPVAKGGHARAVGGAGTFPIVYGYLDSLKLGEAEIDAVPVYFRSMPVDKVSPDEVLVDGYLGLSVLNQFIVTIDYEKTKMTLQRFSTKAAAGNEKKAVEPAPPVVRDDQSIDLRSTNNGLLSAVTFIDNEGPLNFIVDTGASLSVISRSSIERLKWQDKILLNRTMRVLGAAGVVESASVLYAPALRVANMSKPNVVLPVLDFSPLNETSGFEQMGILGGDFLKHFKVEIDFSQARLTLTPQSTLITVDREPKAPRFFR